jgi:hypothetical protein
MQREFLIPSPYLLFHLRNSIFFAKEIGTDLTDSDSFPNTCVDLIFILSNTHSEPPRPQAGASKTTSIVSVFSLLCDDTLCSS